MMTKEGFTKIVNFLTPRAGDFVLWCGQISHIVKMQYNVIIPLKIFFSSSRHGSDKLQGKCIIMTKEEI